MTGVLRAEIALLLRRRGTRVVGWTALVLVVAFAVLRFVTSTADTGPAVQRATETATMLAAQTGTPLDLGAAYQEPRYVYAAGAVVGLVLIALIGGAVLAGGDWRTRAVGLTFPDWRRRSGPVVRRILAWAVVAGGITLAALSALTALLLATAALRGSTVGVDVLTVVLLVGRGAVLGGLGGLIGAALASILRSDLLVVIGVLGYVLVVETLVPALLQNGWRTPGNRLIDLAIAADPGRAPHLACDVPRCADAVAAGAGPLVPQLLLVGVAAVLVLVAHRAARRAIWT
jgi:hypothetical protein